MSNMSYCRFENTYRALQDCVHALDDMGINSEDDLSEDERAYVFRMVNAMKKYNEFLGELVKDGIISNKG